MTSLATMQTVDCLMREAGWKACADEPRWVLHRAMFRNGSHPEQVSVSLEQEGQHLFVRAERCPEGGPVLRVGFMVSHREDRPPEAIIRLFGLALASLAQAAVPA